MSTVMQSNTVKMEGSLLELTSPNIEMISEEKMPSLLSLSMTNSLCSNSTFDLDASAFEETEEPILMNYLHSRSRLDSAFLLDDCSRPHYSQICGQKSNILELNCSCSQQSDHDKKNSSNFRKCMSLHDVSHIQPVQLSAKSLNTISCETIHSQSLSSTTKSKDSGFQRSVSCLSFGSGRKNYDHVQSKVKAYIQNIKESEASRKKNKAHQKHEPITQPTVVVDNVDVILDKKDLLLKIQHLKHELEEKALYIDLQQKNYNSLLLKLAEAKNTIDKLRLERISLDYSTSIVLSNSQSSAKNKSVDFPSHEYEPGLKRQTILQSNILKSIEYKDQCSFDYSHSTKEEPFKPSKFSTPDKSKPHKSLNPISNLFSSSSRLGQPNKPLQNLHKDVNLTNNSPCLSACQSSSVSYSGRNSKTSDDKCLLMKQPITKQELTYINSGQIDLPNDDPFDKVKKWQASLPNLNLLETNSSSGSEAIGSQHLDQNNTNYNSGCTLHNFKENEINGFLSEELVAKCQISEKNGDQNHKNVDSGLEKAPRVLYVRKKHFEVTENDNDLLTGNLFKNGRLIENKRQLLNQLNDSEPTSAQIHYQQENKIYCKNQRTNKCSNNSNYSESESQSNPAKSPLSRSLYSHMDSRSYGSGCSDSNSSSSSNVSSEPLHSEFKLSKRHYGGIDKTTKSKIPKLTSNKTCSKFVLREPKLNINSPFNITAEQDSKPSTENNSVCTKKTDVTDVMKNLKTESSQRKAWNSRNNTNFYVCKEFYFKKSVSLEDCFHAIEGMTQKASSIIDIALDRNIHITAKDLRPHAEVETHGVGRATSEVEQQVYDLFKLSKFFEGEFIKSVIQFSNCLKLGDRIVRANINGETTPFNYQPANRLTYTKIAANLMCTKDNNLIII